ncbi:MAG: FMN-binding protein [bacterium]|jgi:uncharacterized protein with FMN-binding domain
MRNKRGILTVVLIVAALAALAGVIVKVRLENNLTELAGMALTEIDLTKISDGVYSGSYKVFPVAAQVRVTVAGHRITGIEMVEHKNGRGAAAEVIPAKVTEAQSLQVEAVSGATYSSKVILKAIEAALGGAAE